MYRPSIFLSISSWFCFCFYLSLSFYKDKVVAVFFLLRVECISSMRTREWRSQGDLTSRWTFTRHKEGLGRSSVGRKSVSVFVVLCTISLGLSDFSFSLFFFSFPLPRLISVSLSLSFFIFIYASFLYSSQPYLCLSVCLFLSVCLSSRLGVNIHMQICR